MRAKASRIGRDARRSAVRVVATASLLFPASAARAAPTQSERALADVRFKEGKALLDKGKVDDACAKLEESQRLYPRGGTLLNLATCHEAQNRLATAWAEFVQAEKIAAHDKREDRRKLAAERTRALEPKLSWLTIRLAAGVNPSVVEVRRDGELVAPRLLGTAIPVDPGEHVVEASSPGKPPFRSIVRTGASGERKEVEVPATSSAGPSPEGAVRVRFGADAPGTWRLFGKDGGELCALPCAYDVVPHSGAYLQSGTGDPIPASLGLVEIRAPAVQAVVVSPESRVPGFVMLGGGATLVATALIMFVVPGNAEEGGGDSCDHGGTGGWCGASVAFFISGGLALVGGTIWAASADTRSLKLLPTTAMSSRASLTW